MLSNLQFYCVSLLSVGTNSLQYMFLPQHLTAVRLSQLLAQWPGMSYPGLMKQYRLMCIYSKCTCSRDTSALMRPRVVRGWSTSAAVRRHQNPERPTDSYRHRRQELRSGWPTCMEQSAA